MDPAPPSHGDRRHRTRAQLLTVVLLMLPFVAAACADDASTATGGSSAGSSTETSTPSGTAPAARATATVDLADKDLAPVDVVVQTGGTVTWTNSDTVDHQIVSVDSDVIRSPVLGQGGSYTALFTMPGEYPYYCNIHNFMKGTVVVR